MDGKLEDKPFLQAEEDVFVRLDPDTAFEDREGNGQDDVDGWRNWHMDDPEPECFHECDEDDGLLTASGHGFEITT